MNKTTPFAYSLVFWLGILQGAWADEPAPPPVSSPYEEAGISPNREYVNQALNEHIDPFTGKLQLHYVDLFIPGNGGLDLKVQRVYNSLNDLGDLGTSAPRDYSPLGTGWKLHFGQVSRSTLAGSFCQADQPVKLELPDGHVEELHLSSADHTTLISANRWKGECSGGDLVVHAPDGTDYQMNAVIPSSDASRVMRGTTRITDRNGNTLDFSYVPLTGGIQEIVASDGRHVSFNYDGFALRAVKDEATGITWQYEQAPIPFLGGALSKVTRPDGRTWEYAYQLDASPGRSGFGSLARLTYPGGGKVDYEYGSVRFTDFHPKVTVVSQKSGFGGVWKYAYTPATKAPDVDSSGDITLSEDAMMDRTDVVQPDGVVHTYKHLSANRIMPGFMWAIGLLLEESLDDGYERRYNFWIPQTISDDKRYWTGVSPLPLYEHIATPLLASSSVVRNGMMTQTRYEEFDAFGRAHKITEQGTDKRVTTVAYKDIPGKWMLGLPETRTTDTIGTMSWTYDGNGNRLTEDRYGVLTRFTYTSQGDLASRTDARGTGSSGPYTTTYSGYHRGVPQTENQPESVTVLRTVDQMGNVLSETDGEGATTQYRYDRLNRIIRIEHPVGDPVTVAWDPRSRVVRRGRFVETTNFDEYGRAASTKVEGGASGPVTQTFAFDAMGRKTFVSYPNQGNGTWFAYDALGRQKKISHVTPGGLAKRFQYNWNTLRVTDERNNDQLMTYRVYGDPDGMELASTKSVNTLSLSPGAIMSFCASESCPTPVSYTVNSALDMTLNGLGQPLTITQDGAVRTNIYDSHYFLASTNNPETGLTVYGRDEVGNMISKAVGSGPTTWFDYDARNRNWRVRYPSGTPTVVNTFYKDDKPHAIDNGVTRREYQYTGNKKLSGESLAVDGRTLSVSYAYDGNDALSSMTYSTGLTTNFAPDALGRPTQALPFANLVGYHPNGVPQQIHYANGIVSTFTLDDRTFPQNVLIKNYFGATLADLTNAYDPAGNVSQVIDGTTGRQNRTFGYDAMNRLTDVATPDATGGVITYDAFGNIRTQSLGTFSLNHTYDTQRRLASVTGSRAASFSYDVYGNVTANGRNAFSYDDASMLRCVDCGSPGQITYVYDGAGTRVSATKAGKTTWYMYGNGGELLFEQDSDGTGREYGYVAGRNIAKKELP